MEEEMSLRVILETEFRRLHEFLLANLERTSTPHDYDLDCWVTLAELAKLTRTELSLLP